MTNSELAEALRHGLFASRNNIKDAISYAYAMIETIPAEGGSRIAAYTALHVVCNTIADALEGDDESN